MNESELPLTGADDTERRRFFRIQDEVRLAVRVVTEGDLMGEAAWAGTDPPGRQALANTFSATTQQTEYLLRRIKEDQPDIARYLGALNEKLDLLARLLSLEESGLADMPARLVSLSAVGVSFPWEREIAPPASVEITMLLAPSLQCVRALGKVLRCENAPRAQGVSPYRISVEFAHIGRDERELLIQHIVQRESALLREKRSG